VGLVTTISSIDETNGTRGAGALLPVLRVIPEECYQRSTARGMGLIVRSVAVYAAILVALAFAHAWWMIVPLWIVSALAVAGLFVLGHDAAHLALFDSNTLNRRLGRALMLPSLHVYESWVVGHNRIHHGHTLRQGMDFVWHPATVEEYRAMNRHQRLRQRVEWSMFGAGLYYLRVVWWNKMVRFTAPERYKANVTRDERFVVGWSLLAVAGVGAIGWFIGAGGVFGAAWLVVKLLVVPFLLFSWLIGLTVYVHHISPDIKWWPRRTWNSFHGQVEGTTVLQMPKVINFFLHNIMVHVPHHVDVRIPCYELPRAAEAIIAAFPEVDHRRFTWGDYRRTVKTCKLYDFDAQTWLPYSAAKTA
jgi:omega-6 fatty acid desaturase (delta-12 desaturase)